MSTVSMFKTVPFQAIQFSISTQFSSIWSIDRYQSGATTVGQSGPGNDGKEGVIRIPQNSRAQLLLCSAFVRLVQGHRKALNHFSFTSLLSFRKSCIISRHRIIFVSIRFLTFTSFQQHRSIFTSQPSAVLCKASAQTDVSSNSSARLSAKIFPSLYNFPDVLDIHVVTRPI